MDLIQFIHSSHAARSEWELEKIWLGYLTSFGLDRFMLARLSHGTCADKEKDLGLMVNYPREWLDHYLTNHYAEIDPVYRKGLSTRKPFTWEEARLEFPSEQATHVMNEAWEFKLCGGVGLSLYGPRGSLYGIGFAGSTSGVRNDRTALGLLQTASYHFLTVHADLICPRTPPLVVLTARETEVLQWIADGKTKAEVAEALSVSQACIKRHCEAVFGKLGTNTLAASVAKALRLGLLPF